MLVDGDAGDQEKGEKTQSAVVRTARILRFLNMGKATGGCGGQPWAAVEVFTAYCNEKLNISLGYIDNAQFPTCPTELTTIIISSL
ncbi:hypothetical protein WJ971_17560 [Achromobacter xylosoxidans]